MEARLALGLPLTKRRWPLLRDTVRGPELLLPWNPNHVLRGSPASGLGVTSTVERNHCRESQAPQLSQPRLRPQTGERGPLEELGHLAAG